MPSFLVGICFLLSRQARFPAQVINMSGGMVKLSTIKVVKYYKTQKLVYESIIK